MPSHTEPKRIQAPFTPETVASLRAGDRVLISGWVLTARDAAHKRLYELIEAGKPLPVELTNQTIYYVGPTPAPPGRVIGSAGPTTSGRVDKYTPALLAQGLKGMIGKGYRSQSVKEAVVRFGAVYLTATGGAGARLSSCIRSVRPVAYEDLGTEAIRALELVDFPAVVILDQFGGDQYETGQAAYRTLNLSL